MSYTKSNKDKVKFILIEKFREKEEEEKVWRISAAL